MAYIAQDPNTSNQTNTTDVLNVESRQGAEPKNTTQSQVSQPTTSGSGGQSYVSDGNPYGQYASNTSTSGGSSQSARKTASTPSSGNFTNVQTYVDKNKQSSEQLGQGVANKLNTTADIARKNLEGVNKQYGQSVQAGSLDDYGNAVNQAQTAFNEAATGTAGTKKWNANQASMYAPTKTAEGKYSVEDQALVDANKARATFGDGSTKDYATQAEAQNAIDSYNQSNPGYYTYGDESPLSVSNDRLSDILNASYQGPNELSEMSGYGQAYNQYQDLGQLQNQALSSGPKTELLNRTFATPNTEYNLGNKLLDELLLGQGNANKILTDTAKGLGKSESGKVGDEFSGVAKDARTLAQNQTAEMKNIKDTARKALSDTAIGRNTEIEGRINEVIGNWDKYPQYFKDRFQGALDQHNKDSEQKKAFDNIANQYQGGYDAAVNDASTGQKQLQDITSKIGNLNASDIDFAKNIMYSPQNGYFLDRKTGKQADTQKLQRIFDSANNSGMGIEVTGGSTVPYTMENYKNVFSDSSGVILGNQLSQLVTNRDKLQQKVQSANQVINQATPYLQYRNYDPNALNLNLSQLEAEALGVQGGEGLYNLLQSQGIDGLLKTATADKNKLISQDEQSQLSRLQSLAELAKGYGSADSGIDFRNQYTNRDIAGTQNATSALDMDNFRNLLQGAERDFRTDAAGSNIVGQGYGTGSSGGAFDTKRAQAWKTVDTNFGDLLGKADAYRNMYSDEGTDNNLLRQIANSAQGKETFGAGYVNPNLYDTVDQVAGIPQALMNQLTGGATNSGAGRAAINYGMLTNPATAALSLGNIVGGFVGGSKEEAQARADQGAYENAIANLRQNVENKINTTGLKNQFGVKANNAQDLELYKLLGMLDTTNL